MTSIETRLERLERLRSKTAPQQPVEIHVIGAWRDADGSWHEDDTPAIVIHIPPLHPQRPDKPAFP
jgi:hypothetical protein